MTGRYLTADATVAAYHGVAVTPSDVTVIQVTRSLYIGSAGNLVVRFASGSTVTFTAVAAGILPVQVDMVLSIGAGTTATNIIALY